jgi:hypothetical protein
MLNLMARKCHFGAGPVGSHFLGAEPSPDAVGWADVEDDYVLFAGLIFISALLEGGVTGAPEFAERWKGRPVLVIHRDSKGRPGTASAAVEQMEADGVRVTYHREPEGGHLLLFAQFDEGVATVERWSVEFVSRVWYGR